MGTERSSYREMAFLYKWICGSLLAQVPFEKVKHRYKSLTKYYRVEKRKKKRRLQMYEYCLS